MGKSTPSMPAAPDPVATANAQGVANANTARVTAGLGRVNQVNPYYSTSYSQGYSPGYTPPSSYPGSGGGAGPQQGTGGTAGTLNPPPPSVGGGPAQASSVDSSGGSGSQGPAFYDGQGNAHNADGSQYTGDPYAGSNAQTTPPSPSTPGGPDEGAPGPQDQWTQTTTLSPAEQALFNQQNEAQLGVLGLANSQIPRIGNALNQTTTYNGLPQNVSGVDYSQLQSVNPYFQSGQIQNGVNLQSSIPGMGGLTYGVNQGSIQNQIGALNQPDPMSVGGPSMNAGDVSSPFAQAAISNSIYNQMASRLDPQWQGNTEQFTQGLADRGIDPTSEQGQRLSQQFAQSKNDAYQTAQNAALQGSISEMGTAGNLGLQQYGLQNQAQNQAFGQSLSQNQNIFNQALQSGQFGNQAQALAFGEGLQNANLNNSAQQQQFSANLAQGDFANQAALQSGQFANQAQQQGFGQQMSQQQLADQLRSQGLSEQQVNAQLAAYARSQGYTELNNVRLQPLTDTHALLSAGG